MDLFRRAELNELIEHETEPCVSIYMPTHRSGRDREQDPIRLKNLLKSAESQLVEQGLRGPEARDLLEEGTRLLGDPKFWKHCSDGLAMFFAPAFYRGYRVPVSFEEALRINQRFFVHPLLPLLHTDGRFYVLALSMKHVRLYRGTKMGLDEIEVEGMPENMEEALQHEDLQTHLQHRSWGARMSGVRRPKQSLGALPGSGAVFHGQGADEDARKPDMEEFFKQVNDAVVARLHDERAPMVLACVEYEAPLYRAHNRYPVLLEAVVEGNPEQWNAVELHRRAWEAVEPHFREHQEVELGRFRRLPADRISTDLKNIAEAADRGRVEALFVPSGGNGAAGGARGAGVSPTHEMLDDIAATVLRTGGDVFATPEGQMPDPNAKAAAVFRYALP
jgi:hypothetical protein